MIACRSGKTLTSKGVSVFLLGEPGMNTKGCIQKAEKTGNATLVAYGEILKFI